MGLAPNPYQAGCPSRALLGLIGDKWSLLLIPLLAAGPMRNGELLRRVDGISQKMLTQTLKALEHNGIVERHDHHEVPPRVDYSLTPLGLSLAKLVGAIDDWVVTHFSEMEAARARTNGETPPRAAPDGSGAPAPV